MVALLVQGYSVAQASEATGIRRSTIGAWRKDPKFRDQLEQAEGRAAEAMIAESVSQAMLGIRDLADRAREVLDSALTHPDPRVQLQAASMVLRYSAPQDKVQVNVGLEARLANIQAQRGD